MKYLSLLVLSFLLFSCTGTDKVKENVQSEKIVEIVEVDNEGDEMIENAVEDAINEILNEENIEIIEIDTERVKTEEELANPEKFDPVTGDPLSQPE